MEISRLLIPTPQCRLSDPENPHKLCRRYPTKKKKLCRRYDPPLSVCFLCKSVQQREEDRYYFYCVTCDLEFHRVCHLLPSEIKHPFHLLHPLTLIGLDPDDSSFVLDWDSETYSIYPSDKHEHENSQKCKSCRRNLNDIDPYYHCSICNLSLHFYCALDIPLLTIENLKHHEHTLTLFPRQLPLPCDACGFSLDSSLLDPVYSCLLCNYMVHKKCIYLPRVIKITRHPHRLSHTSSIVPPGDFSCGVCRKPVDVSYGQYTCNKGCHYAVHSKCATKYEVWDGKDLEGVPEEEEEVIDPFVRIDEETIQHFSHEHHCLKIHGNGHHDNKFCQACNLWITVSDRFYCCIKCDFVLHEECASLPRIKHHPLHKHPLTLFPPFSAKYPSRGVFRCDGCHRFGCGFLYQCCEKKCSFELDARCASLIDPSIHDCHPRDHPLFFNLTEGKCMGLQSYREPHCSKSIECIKCNAFLCLKCATLPCEAHYKHDRHPLTLCYGEEKTTNVKYWCEICETELDATEWFYTCNSCSVTLHVTCLLGKEVYYMKPNHIIKIFDEKIEICNNGNSRPVCNTCRSRCIYNLVFKTRDRVFCSLTCFYSRKSL